MKFILVLLLSFGSCALSLGQNATISLRNNSALNLELTNDAVSIPSIDEGSFEVYEPSIPFYSNTLEIGIYNIDNKSVIDFFYSYNIIISDSTDTLRIDYRTLFSDDQFSVEVASKNVDPPLDFTTISDSNSASFELTFGGYEMTFKAGKTGENSYLFLLHANDQADLDLSELEEENTLNVLTYNIFMLPPPIYYSNQWARARAIPDEIRGYDVVILQEAFMYGINTDILFPLLENDYPYITKEITQQGKPEDAGVYILSRWPIEASDFIVYDRCSGVDCLSAKGVRYAIINKLGVRYHLFGTHADAGRNEAKKFQYQQAREFMDGKQISPYEAVLFGGDFNMRYREPLYNAILDTLEFVEPNIIGYPWSTANRKNVIDYVFDFQNYLVSDYSFNNTLILRSTKDEVLPILDLSDHYAVHGHFEFPEIEPEVVFDTSNVQVDGNNIVYESTTSLERRSKFSIGEYSLDGINYMTIDTLSTNVFSDDIVNYTFSLADNNEPLLYFRNKMVFQNENFEYSEIITLNRVPSAINENISSELEVNELIKTNGPLTITIHSYSGQRLINETIRNLDDYRKLRNFNNFSTGTYILQFYSRNGALLRNQKINY